MGLDPDAAPGATLEEQLDLVWANMRVILGSAGMTVDNIVRLTSYLRDGSCAEANAAARTRTTPYGRGPGGISARDGPA